MKDEIAYANKERSMGSTGTGEAPDSRVRERELIEMIRRLTREEQAAVRSFVERLQSGEFRSAEPSFLSAVDEFMEEHPELLRKLAQ